MQDWNADPLNKENDITSIYHKEVEELLQQLYPPVKKKKKDKDYGQVAWVEQNCSVITRGDK